MALTLKIHTGSENFSYLYTDEAKAKEIYAGIQQIWNKTTPTTVTGIYGQTQPDGTMFTIPIAKMTAIELIPVPKGA